MKWRSEGRMKGGEWRVYWGGGIRGVKGGVWCSGVSGRGQRVYQGEGLRREGAMRGELRSEEKENVTFMVTAFTLGLHWSTCCTVFVTVLVLHGLHNQILPSSAHSGVVQGHIEFLSVQTTMMQRREADEAQVK